MSQELRLFLKHRPQALAGGRSLIVGATTADLDELNAVAGERCDYFFADHAAFCAATSRVGGRAMGGVWHEATTAYDQVLVFLPKSNSRRDMWLANAAGCVATHGEVTLVGQKSHGIKSARTPLLQCFSQLKSEAYGYHSHLFVAGAPKPQPDSSVTPWLSQWSLERAGRTWLVTNVPGVFSEGRLDQGTKLLLDHLTVPAGAAVLDVGCGAGILGLVAASEWRPSRVVLTDVDYAAVSSARLTLEAAAAELSAPIEVKASDVYTSVEGAFDLILSNPPFHQGMENDETVPRRIIEGAPQLLKRGGSLLLVANSFLPYPNLLDRAFGSHRTLAKNSRFTVYQAVRA